MAKPYIYSKLSKGAQRKALDRWHENRNAAEAKAPGVGGTGTSTHTPAASPPFDPLAPSFTTQAGLTSAATKEAQSQVQPALDENTSQVNAANAASGTRQHELQSWYTWGGDRLKDAFSRATDAANKLIATQNAGTADEQGALAAALGDQSDNTNRLAQQVGGDAPAPQDSQVLAAALASSQAANRFSSDTAHALTQGTGERVGDIVPMGIEAGRKEQGRLQAIIDGLSGDRKSIMARLPDLITTSRNDLRQTEFNKAQAKGQLDLAKKQFGEAKANRLFQQWLASQQLDLSKQNQSFQQWLAQQNFTLDTEKFSHQKQIDWANIGLQQQSVNNQLKQIEADAATAGKGDKKEKAKLRAQQWQNGLALLSGYMSPADGEAPPGLNIDKLPEGDKRLEKYNNNYQPRQFSEAMRILTGQAGMTKSDAFRLLAASNNKEWRDHAKYAQRRLKRRGKGQIPMPTWEKYQAAQQAANKASGPSLVGTGGTIGG